MEKNNNNNWRERIKSEQDVLEEKKEKRVKCNLASASYTIPLR